MGGIVKKTKIIIAEEDLKTILQRAIEQYEKTGRIPSYDELEGENALLGVEIQKMVDAEESQK
jgi:hypothetical protein